MNRKKLWLLVLATIVLTSFISGCIGGGQFGAPSTESSVTIKGIVVTPENDCFTDACSNPSITEGEPLPNADIILKGNNGHILTGKTDCAGNYQISGLTDEGYILYANRGEIWVKKAISPVTGDGGEANYKTTAQVILWEVVENSFPGSILIKDIPDAIPFENIPEDFYEAVRVALADCRDAQKDATVIGLAKTFANTNFGAPCAPCVTPTPTPIPGCVDKDPYAKFSINQDGLTVTFEVPDEVYGHNYFWDFGDGQTSTKRNPGSHTYDESYRGQTITIKFTATNKCNKSSDWNANVEFQKVCPLPDAKVQITSPTPPIHVGDTIQFSAAGSTGNGKNITLYEWDMSYDGNTFNPEASGATMTTQSKVFNTAGTYTVAVRITTECGTDIDSISVEVNEKVCPLPDAKVQITSPTPPIHVGDTIQFSAAGSTGNGKNITLYEWDMSYDGNTFNPEASGATMTTQSKVFNTAGTYTVAVRITTECGTDIDSISVEVKNKTCSTDTAWGGNSSGGGNSWWFYYDMNIGGTQTIWAGQTKNAGSVTISNGTISINLTGGWELQNVNEPVKIQGYDTIPTNRPAAGQFTTYKGTSLTVTNIGSYRYYAIHLDVQKCN